MFEKTVKFWPERWVLISSPEELTVERIKKENPRYMFFPDWSWMVPKEILDLSECVVFHETDVPYGRGGSPIQNLIAEGRRETKICAIRMTENIDQGPVYLKRDVSLEGAAEEIYLRCAKIITQMIREIIDTNPASKPQEGEEVKFVRRTLKQSAVPVEEKELDRLFDHIRMLDAEGYPPAFVEAGGIRIEFTHPVLRTGRIETRAKITPASRRQGDEYESKSGTPDQSNLPLEEPGLGKLFEALKALDADESPAFVEIGNIRIEFSHPVKRTDRIDALTVIRIKSTRD